MTFGLLTAGPYPLNKVYFVNQDTPGLMSVLGSKCVWFYLFGDAGALRGGKWRLITGEAALSRVPLPTFHDPKQLQDLAREVQSASELLSVVKKEVLHRLADIMPAIEKTTAFYDWLSMDFDALRVAIRKRFRGADFPVPERDEWERWYEGRRAEAAALMSQIADAEVEINERVFALYALDRDEIDAIEDALQGQY